MRCKPINNKLELGFIDVCLHAPCVSLLCSLQGLSRVASQMLPVLLAVSDTETFYPHVTGYFLSASEQMPCFLWSMSVVKEELIGFQTAVTPVRKILTWKASNAKAMYCYGSREQLCEPQLMGPQGLCKVAITVLRPYDWLCFSNLDSFIGRPLSHSLWHSCAPSLLSSLQWQGETQEFCPNAKIVLVGCKLDMRTDLNTLRELSKQRLIPVTHEQVGFCSCSSPQGLGTFLLHLL